MTNWKKFGIVLYCSTTLAATASMGLALFVGLTPFNINIDLFSKNLNKDRLFIAAAASLAYITLSALTMFCVLVNKPTKELDFGLKSASDKEIEKSSTKKSTNTNPTINSQQQKPKVADDNNPLLQKNSKQSDNKGISHNNFQNVNKNAGQANKKHSDARYNQQNDSSSNIDSFTPSSQLGCSKSKDSYVKLEERTNEGQGWKKTMRVPEHLTVQDCSY